MSRGLGRLERFILHEIAKTAVRNGPVLLRPWRLAYAHFMPEKYRLRGTPWNPSIAQRKAMLRAMHSFVRKFPQYGLMGGQGRKTLFLYEKAAPESVIWATESVNSRRERNPVTLNEALHRAREASESGAKRAATAPASDD